MIFNGRIMKSGGGGTEFPTLDEVLTWDSFDMAEAIPDGDGDSWKVDTGVKTGINGCWFALVYTDNYTGSSAKPDKPNGHVLIPVWYKQEAKADSDIAVRAGEMLAVVSVTEVVVPLLTGNETLCIASLSCGISIGGDTKNIWFTTGVTIGHNEDSSDGTYTIPETLQDSPIFKPIVYYKAF
uniref:Uncharacterized protein n=1 Tax=Myoviridae sp. ctagO6 TaxID=2826667 RepID=A0A8S5NQ50_9CAUD|nr:MAG TPA: hypothetical protein [Myoviridae sp. ctagO6]